MMALMIGTVNYVGTTYETRLIPKEVAVLPPLFLIKHDYWLYSWIQSYLQPSAHTQWPIDDILAILTRRAAGIEERHVESGRIQFLNRAQRLSGEAFVRLLYGQLLKREPDEESRGYVEALREGKLTREGMFDAMIASSEYRERPSRILVVPNHPVFNAVTLQYYAELHRYPLMFSDYPLSFSAIHFDVQNILLMRDQLQGYDFILWKNGGYQYPTLYPYYRLTTTYNKQFYAELIDPESGFVPLSRVFAFPDGSHITIFAASYLLK